MRNSQKFQTFGHTGDKGILLNTHRHVLLEDRKIFGTYEVCVQDGRPALESIRSNHFSSSVSCKSLAVIETAAPTPRLRHPKRPTSLQKTSPPRPLRTRISRRDARTLLSPQKKSQFPQCRGRLLIFIICT